MITRGVGLASGVGLVLAAVTVPGPAGMATPAQGVTAASAPVAWVVNSSVRSATRGVGDPDRHRDQHGDQDYPGLAQCGRRGCHARRQDRYVTLNSASPGGRGSVVPVSTSTYQVGKPVKVASNLPATMAVTPDGKTLYPGDWYTVSCSWIRERL